MGRPRELITELIGEEDTERYFNGEGIEIKGLSYTYIIERKRGYADIVRNRAEVDGYYNPRDGYHRRNVVATASGRIRAWNIDDAVASFIVAARAGKVNWACGNIDVRLPSSMPPKDLGVLTFLQRGVGTAFYATIMGVEKIRDFLVGETVTQLATVIGGWWLLNMLIAMLVVLAAPMNAEGDRVVSYFWDSYIKFTLVQATPLYILLLSIKYYFVWKRTWEVKMS